MYVLSRNLLSLAFVFSFLANLQAFEFSDLLAKLPAESNAVIVFDVQQALASPIAEQQGWGKKLELAYVERPVFLPPEASKLVMAASLDASDSFRRNWEIAVMDMPEPMSMRSVARSEGGYIDDVQETPVAWTPSDAYFVSLETNMLGVVYPANRQYTGRWIKSVKENSEAKISDYLQSVVEMTSDEIPIVLAMDLSDLPAPHKLNDRVSEAEIFKNANLSAEQVVPILASLQGAMLRLAVDADVQAELRIDFAKDVTPLKAVAKQLVIEAMDELGMEIADMEDWRSKVESRSIRMAGKLSPEGLRRVFSIVELPSAKFSLLKDEGAEGEGQGASESKMRESSLVYYRSVDTLLRDLKRDLQGNKAVSAVLERYARKIDRMPILNVDPALLDYGADVAETLRMVALSRRKGGIQAGTATAGMGGRGYADYSYDYGYGGSDRYAGARLSASDRSAYKAKALAESKNARVEGAKQIAESSAAIRRAMTEKYQVEF